MEPAMGVKKTGFSYGDYQTWDKDQRWEIFRGEAYLMTPAPPRRHQEISPEVYTEEDSLPVALLEGLVIELGPVFKD